MKTMRPRVFLFLISVIASPPQTPGLQANKHTIRLNASFYFKARQDMLRLFMFRMPFILELIFLKLCKYLFSQTHKCGNGASCLTPVVWDSDGVMK